MIKYGDYAEEGCVVETEDSVSILTIKDKTQSGRKKVTGRTTMFVKGGMTMRKQKTVL